MSKHCTTSDSFKFFPCAFACSLISPDSQSFSSDLSANCEVFAQPSLCYSAFPICVDESRTNMYEQHMFQMKADELISKLKQQAGEVDLRTATAELYRRVRNEVSLRRICREDCEILENELCRVEYAIAKKHPVIGRIERFRFGMKFVTTRVIIISGQTLNLEECINLPNKNEKHAEYCLPLGIDRSQNVQEGNRFVFIVGCVSTCTVSDDTCYTDKGESYRGTQDVSANGSRCLMWSVQLQISISEHPELAGGHAYCRNPGSIELAPFCYVDGNRRELCDIPQCCEYSSLVGSNNDEKRSF